jgi:hypothetical protein
VPVGGECYADTYCVTGAACNLTDQACYCNKDVAEDADDKLSKPKEGNVFGTCGTCLDKAAICSPESKCVCKPGFAPSTSDLTCKVSEGEQCESTNECVAGRVCDKRLKTCKLEPDSPCDRTKTGTEWNAPTTPCV